MKKNELRKKEISLDKTDIEVNRKEGCISALIDTSRMLGEKYIKSTAVNQRQSLLLAVDFYFSTDSLKVFFLVEGEREKYRQYKYSATKNELRLIKELIIETLQKEFNMTPQEYYNCDKFVVYYTDKKEIGGEVSGNDDKELKREHLKIDREMDIDLDIGQEITAYLETWFDVDKKFGINVNGEDSTWLNMYAKYNPFEDTLRIECEIDREKGSEYFDYEPTENESKLIKEMIAEKIQQEHGETPQEFCNKATDYNQGIGGQT